MGSGVYRRLMMDNGHWCGNMINVVVLRWSIKGLVVNIKTNFNNRATLHQLEGSLNGVSGRFEWIVDPKLGGVSHRMFPPNGTINGISSKP